MLSRRDVDRFIASERLPGAYAELIDEHFLPLARWLDAQYEGGTLLAGINGAQGTGKTTLAAFLGLALTDAGRRTAVLSLDDFYLGASERRVLAHRVHPLLATRGVPGTHDVGLLERTLETLRTLGAGDTLRVPVFDKAADDRLNEEDWRVVTGPLDVVLLEGWCVGSRAQDEDALRVPVNELEREQDSAGRWRRYVNERLTGRYRALFDRLDRLIVLHAPGFQAVHRWRLEQERKLAASGPPGAAGLMSPEQLRRFIQHFERLTRANLALLPATADVVFELDDSHGCKRHVFKAHRA